MCTSAKEYKKDLHMRVEVINLNRSDKDCSRPIEPGYHRDIALRFCMPTKKQFLRTQGISERDWKKIFEVRVSKNVVLSNFPT